MSGKKQLIGVEYFDSQYGAHEVRLTWKLPRKVRQKHPLFGDRTASGGLQPMTDIELEVSPFTDRSEALNCYNEYRGKFEKG